MATIGEFNTMTIIRQTDNGFYLDADELGEVLYPHKFIAKDDKIGDKIEAFLYRDSEDRLIATGEEPYACVEEFALLEVKSATKIGAFLDWGLPKDLLVPFSEQETRMEEGFSYVVYIYLDDKTGRIVGTSRLGRFLDEEPATYNIGEEVEILIYNQNEIGYQAIVNGMHRGMIYKNQAFTPIKRGAILTAYVKQIREDGKIDLNLEKLGHSKIDGMSKKIFDKLELEKGFLPVNDKSSPDDISKLLGISKKNFKKSIGSLYKQGLITIEKDGIRRTEKQISINEQE